MTILDEIVAKKRIEIAELKKNVSIKELEFSPYFSRKCYSAKASILDISKSGIIAEHKRKSPSKGIINGNVQLVDVVEGYEKAGASCISVLTDSEFFGGSKADLLITRRLVKLPILRKDFVVDEYQIVEAKSIGADFILLIAASLEKDEVSKFAKLAKSLGMEVLMEVHTEEELGKCCPELDIVGVNNRNLKDFSVDIELSVALFDKIPNEFLKISESGLSTSEAVLRLKKVGYKGFLMGENFMKEANPGKACMEFISKIK
jgi:indole-3-glycerol phosphate synthase